MNDSSGIENTIKSMNERAKTLVTAVNRTGLEDVLFAGSSYQIGPKEGYGAAELKRDQESGIPGFMLRVKNPNLRQLDAINTDRAKGISGYLPVFTNLHTMVALPAVDESGVAPHEWEVKAGKDGTETPDVDEYYKDLVELEERDGKFILKPKAAIAASEITGKPLDPAALEALRKDGARFEELQRAANNGGNGLPFEEVLVETKKGNVAPKEEAPEVK